MASPQTTFHALSSLASNLNFGWHHRNLGSVSDVQLKVFRVDKDGLPEEKHAAYTEALYMLDGHITFLLDGREIVLKAGDLQLIPAGCAHSILPGGQGSFLLLDPELEVKET